MEPATTEVAAFWPDEQFVDASLTITNSGPSDVSLDLDWAASHDGWTVDLDEPAVDVAAAAAATVPLVIHAPPDAGSIPRCGSRSVPAQRKVPSRPPSWR